MQLFLKGVFIHGYDVKFSFLKQIIRIQLYGFKYFYLILIIIWFQVIIFIKKYGFKYFYLISIIIWF